MVIIKEMPFRTDGLLFITGKILKLQIEEPKTEQIKNKDSILFGFLKQQFYSVSTIKRDSGSSFKCISGTGKIS